MALSEKERRVLEQLEEQLSMEDPQLASQMQAAGPVSQFSTRNIVIGVLIAVVGIGVLLWGVTISQLWLGIIGFLMMVGGVFFATVRPKGLKSSTARKSGPATGGSGNSAFMSNLEQKWEDRRRQQP
ncbi:DUF3040 domain-containing protein [Citricoccus sp. NR2]|uniref:DUF3040 domain-containing protein n=1 Tax=Citricoccus sp. NR2 TaxID=3004095 RepID=UPI0022DDF48F|nr:DUF3040 domain-containing protein [Citricoccus sp. NR2]WBL18105.1 DUF3040 domain-containing protein [Citricoccus sp. NR2]